MPQVVSGKTSYLQYTVHITSLPLIKSGADGFTGLVAAIKKSDNGYYTKLSSSEIYHMSNDTYHLVYANMEFVCICCQRMVVLEVKLPSVGYDSIDHPHTVETDDEVFFLCSPTCKNNLEMSSNLYV